MMILIEISDRYFFAVFDKRFDFFFQKKKVFLPQKFLKKNSQNFIRGSEISFKFIFLKSFIILIAKNKKCGVLFHAC
jgi:hypothetical protein